MRLRSRLALQSILIVEGEPKFRAKIQSMNAELREKLYLPVKGLVEPNLARFIYQTLLLKQWRGECFRDGHIPTAVSLANDAPTDALLLHLLPRIEEISGCRLVPTYSYARLYFHGDAIIRHRDRTACEISASVHLGRDGGESFLCFAPNTRVDLDCGDGAIYLGCEADHWRESFTGNTMGQIFLHYVVKDGPYAEHYFDGNADRFPPSISGMARKSRHGE
jgi:hypothetical protein